MQKKYRVLLSAYSCEPNKGSEPGIGWHWAMELGKLDHEVHVLTRLKNKKIIEDYFTLVKKPPNLFFLYYDLPTWVIYLKEHGMGSNIYYFLWQIGIISTARKQHEKVRFDLVHHITFGVFRHPSFLYKLKIPLVFGPVGGGEDTPVVLKKSLSFKYYVSDRLRSCLNRFALKNPFLKEMFRKATVIFTKTEQTRDFIPVEHHYKTINYLEIGTAFLEKKREIHELSAFNILFAGRLIYLKGFDIAIPSIDQFSRKYKGSYSYTIIGEGNYEKRIHKLISRSDAVLKIEFLKWIGKKELSNYYTQASVLLFPSYHDSSGNVVLEALLFGIPVICLDCGGPAEILGDKLKQLVISTRVSSKEIIIGNITEILLRLATDKNYYQEISEKSLQRAKELEWSKVVSNAYNLIDEKICSYDQKTISTISHPSASSMAWFLNSGENHL
jgi:glycosyltransferase involved in cell wall biosynthesis